MRSISFVLLVAAVLLSACAPQGDTTASSETPSAPGSSDYAPRTTDGSLTRGSVYISSVDLLTMESYPLQFSLSLKGNLPTPCNELRVSVAPPDKANKIAVEIYSVVNSNAMCAEVLQPFEVNIPLGSFPAGHYSLLVNGQKAAELDT